MDQANISYTRNHLSEILARVREGETILIMDRQRPVARLEPVAGEPARESPWQNDLVRRGLIRPARRRLDPKELARLPLPMPVGGGDVVAAVGLDREEG